MQQVLELSQQHEATQIELSNAVAAEDYKQAAESTANLHAPSQQLDDLGTTPEAAPSLIQVHKLDLQEKHKQLKASIAQYQGPDEHDFQSTQLDLTQCESEMLFFGCSNADVAVDDTARPVMWLLQAIPLAETFLAAV